MQVIRAQHAGACYGVRRALALATDALKTGKSVSSLGSLIHNPRVVKRFEEHGMHVALTPHDIRTQQVVIRSHGVSPDVFEELEQCDVEIIDATCPHVTRAQQAASALAQTYSTVLIVGEDGHPEVEGLKSYVAKQGAEALVCDNAQHLPELLPEQIGVVVQTTQIGQTLEEILANLAVRNVQADVANTICQATQHRQEAAQKLASQVDVMLIIGGRNSANTVHLFELCEQRCAATYHIESVEEIMPSWFEGVQKVGISAGASTPEEHIRDVEEYLLGICEIASSCDEVREEASDR